MATRALSLAYKDTNTLASRLIALAQAVRRHADTVTQNAAHALALPTHLRQGHFTIAYHTQDDAAAAVEALNNTHFESTCGAFSGTLHLETLAADPRTARCALATAPDELERAEAWIAQQLREVDGVEALHVPQLPHKWDSGVAAILFRDAESAHRAMVRLDGVPSFVEGDSVSVQQYEWAGLDNPSRTLLATARLLCTDTDFRSTAERIAVSLGRAVAEGIEGPEAGGGEQTRAEDEPSASGGPGRSGVWAMQANWEHALRDGNSDEAVFSQYALRKLGLDPHRGGNLGLWPPPPQSGSLEDARSGHTTT